MFETDGEPVTAEATDCERGEDQRHDDPREPGCLLDTTEVHCGERHDGTDGQRTGRPGLV
jgi:hypothetical protein